MFTIFFSNMFKIFLRPIKSRTRCLSVCLLIVIYIVFDSFGILMYFFEKNFFTEFNYPYNGDVQSYVMQLRMNITPDVRPINTYNYSIEKDLKTKCLTSGLAGKIRLVYVIKSSVRNQKNRNAIRTTWGYEKRFSDVEIRTVFLIGKSRNREWDQDVLAEANIHQDIVLVDYHDNYYNNTIKTMMGFKWAVTFCPNAQFYMFADDDYYVSTRNVLRYIRNPTNYPEYIKPFLKLKSGRNIVGIEDFDLSPDVRFYSGFVFQTKPHRHKISKWYVSLEEYPYHLWPPYATAGAYILSQEALLDMYYTSYFTKHFRFDDIYVGLLAFKSHIEPLHCDEFYFNKKKINVNSNYEFVIASHGYDNLDELISVWNVQRGLGNA